MLMIAFQPYLASHHPTFYLFAAAVSLALMLRVAFLLVVPHFLHSLACLSAFALHNPYDLVQKAMAGGGGGNTVETVMSSGKSQGRPLFIGRHAKCAKESTEALTNAYIHDLRQRLVEEMEAKLESKVNPKVQENLAWVLRKLGDANP